MEEEDILKEGDQRRRRSFARRRRESNAISVTDSRAIVTERLPGFIGLTIDDSGS